MGVRHCKWLRFLRLSLLMDDAVNIIGTKASSGEPLFEVTSTQLVLIYHVCIRPHGLSSRYILLTSLLQVVKSLEPETELVAFLVPEANQEVTTTVQTIACHQSMITLMITLSP